MAFVAVAILSTWLYLSSAQGPLEILAYSLQMAYCALQLSLIESDVVTLLELLNLKRKDKQIIYQR
ncbi:MAG: hypothetical protein AAF902_05810 [Chloroflexota bacterium]